MNNLFFDDTKRNAPISRVDGRAKVMGKATYSADHQIPGMVYGFLVGSTIAKGHITTLDTRSAERAVGVLAVITYLNASKIPGYETGKDPAKPSTEGQPLRIFSNNKIFYYDQPVALVIADTYERVRHAATLIKVQYIKTAPQTDMAVNMAKAIPAHGDDGKSYSRGELDAYKNAPVKIEQHYSQPAEVHNPMELGSIIALWDGPDNITVYTKTQGVMDTQNAIKDAFKLQPENITVNAEYVGGAFGSALRTWPYEIAAMMGAKKIGKPLKIVLSREQMFTNIGFRPATIQKIGLGATADGILTGLTHEAIAQTSSYEEFTEGTVNISRYMYACPNVNTRYKLVSLDTCTPIWMRGPGEATGAYALECAMDEMAHALNMDPIEFRVRNHADKDPDKSLPWSSKYLKECYEIGAEHIGWSGRPKVPGSLKEGGWLVGYGMGTGSFGAYRGGASVKVTLNENGTLLLQSSVNDMGPGTATMMTKIAADSFGIAPENIKVQMGNTSLPPGTTQGGSATTSTMGSVVVEACTELKEKMAVLAGNKGTAFYDANMRNIKAGDLIFNEGTVASASDPSINASYSSLLKQSGLPQIELTKSSNGSGAEAEKYSMYSFSVHFVKLRVHPATGVIRIDHVVSCADAGNIINEKTAASQIIGGAVGGIGMALMEGLESDHRFGRPINNNLADYHVPVNADVTKTDVLFINKKDPYTNPMGSKGLGEISLIGMAPAVANAVFNATGKRVRSLPITPDKLI